MSRKAEISLPTITAKQSPLVSQQRSTYLNQTCLESRKQEREKRMRRKTRRKRGNKNHWQSPLKLPRETGTIWVIKSGPFSVLFIHGSHVVSLFIGRHSQMPGPKGGDQAPGANACPRPAALGAGQPAAPALNDGEFAYAEAVGTAVLSGSNAAVLAPQ